MHHRSMGIELARDCDALLIPTGTKIQIKQGTLVTVTQALGSSYTVHVNGNLARISGRDGDALGLVATDDEDINQQEGSVEDKVWIQLKTCFDPEIPVNIVDLGLVYDCQVLPLGAATYSVLVTMTLTAPACGMGPVLVADVEEKLKCIQGVTETQVDLVFDPPWDRDRMSDVAKLQLGLL